MHCCSTDISYPRNIVSKADIHLGRQLLERKLAMLRVTDIEALLSPVRTAVLQQNVLAKSLDNLKLPTVLFVEFNTTMALAILTEQRDFVGEVLAKAMGVQLLVVMQH